MTRIGCLMLEERESGDAPSRQGALLEVALAHSPRVEEGGPGLVYLDVAGLRRLHGDERRFARCLVECARRRGLEVRVGIAGSRIGALDAARQGPDVRVVPPGAEPVHLASAPLSLLDLSEELAARLSGWGLRTLGELSALPTPSLFERLGSEGTSLQRLARGDDSEPLRPWQPPLLFEESVELDWPIEKLEPLIALATALTERLCVRLARRGLMADAFEWSCRLSEGTLYEAGVHPAFPMNEISTVKPLLRASLESRQPRGAVEAMRLRALPVRVSHEQGALGDPPRPSPRILAATLARLAAMVGAEQMGAPALLNTHRPDAVRLEPCRLTGPPHRFSTSQAVLALRRLRPPWPARVTLTAERPVHLESGRLVGAILTASGPWRASGEWWTERRWVRDEWDVELTRGTLCRLTHNGSAWFVEGIYD